MELTARPMGDYEYLDAGNGARLERFGPYVLDRPSPAALWPRERPDLWTQAAAVYHRSATGGGHWEFHQRIPPVWSVREGTLTFLVRPTGFGHVGFFPEHTCHWPWLARQLKNPSQGRFRVLNLFAYTGSLTLVAAQAGAEVCHVDAVQEVNLWARQNAQASGLETAPVRWITDDVSKFVAREIRRGRKYDAVILDPPSYGKGPHGEKWIIEEHLPPLVEKLVQLASATPRLLLFTCHTLGFSPPLMRNLLLPWARQFGGTIESGTMLLASPHCECVLPCGFFARWSSGTR